jgi:hypothetical protein
MLQQKFLDAQFVADLYRRISYVRKGMRGANTKIQTHFVSVFFWHMKYVGKAQVIGVKILREDVLRTQ